MKSALITGYTGQDGSYLAELLLSKGYKVTGFVRRLSHQDFSNVKSTKDDVKLVYGDMLDNPSIVNLISGGGFDEIYNLAAQSSPGESFRQPFYTAEVVGLGAHRIFEAVKQYSPMTKVYQASTSEMFGWVKEIPQTEETLLNPANPYAVSKLYAHNMAKIYRKQGVFVACGILFNHESERRGLQFITQKVAYGAACAFLHINDSEALNEENEPIFKDGKLALGNLDAQRDWGYAPDYVEAMWMILQQETPDDFIVSTGEVRTIRDLCEAAFGAVNLKWEDYVVIDKRFIRPTETGPLLGNPAKIKKIGWKPKISFEEMIKLMVKSNISKLK